MAQKLALPSNDKVNQIYQLVNDAYAMSSGTDEIKVVDTSSLVAMGNELANMQKLDIWLNSLSRMIGMTIDDYRAYNGQFSDMKRDNMEYGAFVRKIHTEMPEAVEDDTSKVGLMDGQALDHYIINNPKVKQKIFNIEAPYSFFITTQRKWLKEAFRDAAEMSAFISSIFGAVQNKIEVTHENLGRLAMANFAATVTTDRIYPLVTMYNAQRGTSLATGEAALLDKEFLAFAMAVIGEVSDNMQTMGVLYNEDGKSRFTPKNLQRLAMLSGFKRAFTTIAQRNTFHPEYGEVTPDIVVQFWQANAKPDGSFIQNAGVQTDLGTVDNLVAVLYDYEAMGTFREEQEVLTTPMNARGAYMNTFWHENQMYFNDHGENGVIFTLN